MKKVTLGVIFTALFVAAMGCSSKPSGGDGQAVLEKSLQNLAKVVSFKKTDGKEDELLGVKVYEISFEAEVECLVDCYVSQMGIHKAGGVKVIGMDLVKKQGERIGVKGTISFEKTEKGWQGTMGTASYYESKSLSSVPTGEKSKTNSSSESDMEGKTKRFVELCQEFETLAKQVEQNPSLENDAAIKTRADKLVKEFRTILTEITGGDESKEKEFLKRYVPTVYEANYGKVDIIPANETFAESSLKTLYTTQMMWKQMDTDGNMQKDYWTYDVSCLHRMLRADGKTKCANIDIGFAKADAQPADSKIFAGKIEDWSGIKPQPKSGYFFRAMSGYNQNEVNGVNATNSYAFAFVAYPAEYGKTGKRTFIINESGTVYSKDTGSDANKIVLQWPTDMSGWKQPE